MTGTTEPQSTHTGYWTECTDDANTMAADELLTKAGYRPAAIVGDDLNADVNNGANGYFISGSMTKGAVRVWAFQPAEDSDQEETAERFNAAALNCYRDAFKQAGWHVEQSATGRSIRATSPAARAELGVRIMGEVHAMEFGEGVGAVIAAIEALQALLRRMAVAEIPPGVLTQTAFDALPDDAIIEADVNGQTMIRIAVGVGQRANPWERAAVIHRVYCALGGDKMPASALAPGLVCDFMHLYARETGESPVAMITAVGAHWTEFYADDFTITPPISTD